MRNRIKALTFSGWARVPDMLDSVLPEEITDIWHMFYHSLKGKDMVLDVLKGQARQYDVVIGSGMGGMLAAHAVADGILRPRLLVIIAAPQSTLESLYNAFKASPERFRAKYLEKTLGGDENRDELRVRFWLQADEAHDEDWLNWVATHFTCDKLDFSRMPRTLVIHGQNDALIPASEAEFFRSRIPNCRVEIIPGCGHAPHMHATKRFAALIREELDACGLVEQKLQQA